MTLHDETKKARPHHARIGPKKYKTESTKVDTRYELVADNRCQWMWFEKIHSLVASSATFDCLRECVCVCVCRAIKFVWRERAMIFLTQHTLTAQRRDTLTQNAVVSVASSSAAANDTRSRFASVLSNTKRRMHVCATQYHRRCCCNANHNRDETKRNVYNDTQNERKNDKNNDRHSPEARTTHLTVLWYSSIYTEPKRNKQQFSHIGGNVICSSSSSERLRRRHNIGC